MNTEMIQSGSELSEIPDSVFKTFKTSNSVRIINGLIDSDIKYSARYDTEKLLLAIPRDKENSAEEIAKKADSDNAEYIERLIGESGSTDEFLSLLPEIAAFTGFSESALRERPVEIQLFLAKVYVNNWFCDNATLRGELAKITELGYEAQTENEIELAERSADNNTPERVGSARREQNELDRSADTEKELLRQQAEHRKKESSRTDMTSYRKLSAAFRMRQQAEKQRADREAASRERELSKK